MKWLFHVLFWVALFLPGSGWAQNDSIRGVVLTPDGTDRFEPVMGAHVMWLGTTEGAVTLIDGTFSLKKHPDVDRLLIQFVGLNSDTVTVDNQDFIKIVLSQGIDLLAVEIEQRLQSMRRSFSSVQNEVTIGENELLKAACCNLSESFETNPSVDVSFTDAVTGTRQIQMLGLAGPYTQITRESMPDVRGLAAIYGLTYTPGPWIESIQLIKGTGTVTNGFESMAGQINVELRKPEKTDKLYVNAYGNEMGRLELNLNLAAPIKNSHWTTGLLLHGNQNRQKWDRNEDGFLDRPLGYSFIGINRWKYSGPGGLMMQFGVKGTYDDRQGGQMDFNPETDGLKTRNWGMKNSTQRLEGWAKMGRVFIDKPWKTYGLQLSGTYHDLESYFGLTTYDAIQRSFYANFIYQSIIGNTNHAFKTGTSFQSDTYNEKLNGASYDREEHVPGVFFEYTNTSIDKLTAVLGLRADHHNTYGAFVTPRAHFRYAFTEQTVLRLNAGRGQRTPMIVAENMGFLASSRAFVLNNDPASNNPYGLNAEVAWNIGINLNHTFTLGYRDGAVGVDFYRTWFVNQIVVDREASPQQVLFYNLDGASYSNSLQFQVDYELFKRLDVRLAYRWFDVQTTYGEDRLQKPQVSAHRVFINLAYSTRNYWKLDATVNWQGRQRLPSTRSNPDPYRLDDYSPDFVVMNAQVSKTWKEKFEVYLGVENAFNFRQADPILAAEDPFGSYFDASMVWGPIFGRNLYAGLRFRIR